MLRKGGKAAARTQARFLFCSSGAFESPPLILADLRNIAKGNIKDGYDIGVLENQQLF